MKCSIYIATSTDGYIATCNGDIDWLDEAQARAPKMDSSNDMGFANYMEQIDCIVMGRKTLEKISSFNLTVDQWPYGETKIIVLSKSLKKLPENMQDKATIYCGEIPELISLPRCRCY